MSIIESTVTCPFEYPKINEEQQDALDVELWRVYYPYKFAGDA